MENQTTARLAPSDGEAQSLLSEQPLLSEVEQQSALHLGQDGSEAGSYTGQFSQQAYQFVHTHSSEAVLYRDPLDRQNPESLAARREFLENRYQTKLAVFNLDVHPRNENDFDELLALEEELKALKSLGVLAEKDQS